MWYGLPATPNDLIVTCCNLLLDLVADYKKNNNKFKIREI